MNEGRAALSRTVSPHSIPRLQTPEYFNRKPQKLSIIQSKNLDSKSLNRECGAKKCINAVLHEYFDVLLKLQHFLVSRVSCVRELGLKGDTSGEELDLMGARFFESRQIHDNEDLRQSLRSFFRKTQRDPLAFCL